MSKKDLEKAKRRSERLELAKTRVKNGSKATGVALRIVWIVLGLVLIGLLCFAGYRFFAEVSSKIGF